MNIKSQTNNKELKYAIYIPYLKEIEDIRRELYLKYSLDFNPRKLVRSSNPIMGLLQKYFAGLKIKRMSDLLDLDKLGDYLKKSCHSIIEERNSCKKRVLVVHNEYIQRGGEEVAVECDIKMLKEMGYEVFEYIRTNNELDKISIFERMHIPFRTVFSIKSYLDVKKIIKDNKIDILHVHNTLVMVSPSVYYSGFKCGIPVFQTVHNFRFMCPNGFMYRDGAICEKCLSKNLKYALKYRCYRKSFIQTLGVVTMLKIHRLIGTYNRLNYICLSEFNKEMLLRMNGLKHVFINPGQIYVRPHCIEETIIDEK